MFALASQGVMQDLRHHDPTERINLLPLMLTTRLSSQLVAYFAQSLC